MPTIKARVVDRGVSRSKSPVISSSNHGSNPKTQSSPRDHQTFLSNPMAGGKDSFIKPQSSNAGPTQLDPSPSSKSFKRPETLGLVNPTDNSRSRSRLKILQQPTQSSPTTAVATNNQAITSAFLAPGQRKPSAGVLLDPAYKSSIAGLSTSAASASGHNRQGSDAFGSPNPQQLLHHSSLQPDSNNISTISKPNGHQSQGSNPSPVLGQAPNYSSFLKKISNIRQKKSTDVSAEPKPREEGYKPSTQLTIPKHPTMGHSSSDKTANKENDPRPGNAVSAFSASLQREAPKKDTLKKPVCTVDSEGKVLREGSKSELGYRQESEGNKCHREEVGAEGGKQAKEEAGAIIQDEPLSSKNIFASIPDIQSKDTMGFKIEALRYYLEKKMGLDILLAVYRTLMEESDSESDKPDRQAELPIMSGEQEKFVPFVHQLVYCELNYYSV